MVAAQFNQARTRTQDNMLKFKPNIRMKKKGDISDFECHKVADMLVWVLQNLMIYEDLAAQPSLGVRENSPKMRTYSLRRSYLGKKH